MNTRVTSSFCLRDSFICHTIGRGSAKISRSEKKFMEPLANAALMGRIQCPGIEGVQYLAIGLHPNNCVMRLLNRYPNTKNMTARVKNLNLVLMPKRRR